MSSFDYVLDSANECERLERQAIIDGLERHLRHLPNLSRARILDAGCGSGALARTIASHNPNWDVVGVDLNSAYVAYATSRGQEAKLENLVFKQGNLQALDYEAAAFDIVWSRFVLYFLPDPNVALAEFMRVIRPAGWLIFSLHNLPTMIHYPEDSNLQDRERRVLASLANWQIVPRLPSMLSAAGFCDISVEIELDRIYSTLGRIKPDNRKNVEDVFTAGINRVASILGSRADAQLFISDLLKHFDRDDTYTFSLLWTIKCRAPK
jgi:ubiquinone/menaquinone biosynthesis C-methylase UbiE